MKSSFFQAAVVSMLLYGCTTWTLTKRLEKKVDGNYTRMLRALLNKSWRYYPTKYQLYGHLPPITKTIQVRRTRHTRHCLRRRDELISDALLWTPTYGRAKAGRPARTYIQQLCEDKGCSPEDLPEAMNDREKWWESVRDIRASGTTWWWWCLVIVSTQLNVFSYWYITLWQHPCRTTPDYISVLKPKCSWPVIAHGFFSSPTRGISHFITDTQNTTERVGGKNKRTNTDSSQLQAQAGGSQCDSFVQLSVHLQAIDGE